MLHRKAEQEIKHWIAGDNRALLLYGVRQAGKTFIIRECLKEASCQYAEFNLIENPEVIEILHNAKTTDDLIMRLSLYSKTPLVAGKTVIFLDEIQRCKDIVTRIKFLVEDSRFRYVMSGSLLGVELRNLRSAPVGYLKTLKMYPLDFEEFLQVFGVPDTVIEGVRDSYRNLKPVDETVHHRLMELFSLYMIIGGMPAAVEKYRTSDNIDRVIDEHRAIIELYKLDFSQYEEEERRLILTNIYELIPAELNEQSKRFKIADIDKNLRYDRIRDSFTWLWKAGVALPVFNVTQPTLPLMLNQKSTLFKLFLSDIGMLTTIYGKGTKLKILNGDADINKGAVYENVIAQELAAHGFEGYYYSSKKLGELDFVVEEEGVVLPIEVKSGKSYRRHSALDNVLAEREHEIPRALVFCDQNLHVEGKVIYLPMYMVLALRRDVVEFDDISVNRYLWRAEEGDR